MIVGLNLKKQEKLNTFNEIFQNKHFRLAQLAKYDFQQS